MTRTPAIVELPRLLDRKQLVTEMGVTRAVVDAIFRRVPVVVIPGCRKPMVRRDDVLRLMEESTFDGRTRAR